MVRRIKLPSVELLVARIAHSGADLANWATSSSARSGLLSSETKPMSGWDWPTTSAKNSYREHSASSQTVSRLNSAALSESRDASFGSTTAMRRTLPMYLAGRTTEVYQPSEHVTAA